MGLWRCLRRALATRCTPSGAGDRAERPTGRWRRGSLVRREVMTDYCAPMVRILVVEDDDAIRRTLTRGLAEHGATVTAVATAVEAIKALPVDRPEAVMLDLGLPDLDGADVLALIRAHQRRARRDRHGARRRARDRPAARRRRRRLPDQAVLRGQAMARIRAVLRRTTPHRRRGPAGRGRRAGRRPGLAHGRARRRAARRSTARSSTCCSRLPRGPGEVVSKRQLLAEVWQMPWGGADRTVDVHLSWLRRKLGETAARAALPAQRARRRRQARRPRTAMSLRSRILRPTVGVAAAVLRALRGPAGAPAAPGRDRGGRDGTPLDVAQGVADYLSTGDVDPTRCVDYVDRINDRDDAYPGRGGRWPTAPPSVPAARPRRERTSTATLRGGGRDDDGDDDDDTAELRPRRTPRSDRSTAATSCASRSLVRGRPGAVGRLRHRRRGAPDGRGARLLLLGARPGAAAGRGRRRRAGRPPAGATPDRRRGDRRPARRGRPDARASPDDGPEEVRRVGAALNRLAGRIDELLAAERETVADLSHRLRTPLTAVRLDVESLPDSERKAELRTPGQLERTLDRGDPRRAAPAARGRGPALRRRPRWPRPVRVLGTAGRGPGSRQHRCRSPTGPVDVRCAAADLATALDALLENAVAHTPEGTAIAVVARRSPATARSVSTSGTAGPESRRPRWGVGAATAARPVSASTSPGPAPRRRAADWSCVTRGRTGPSSGWCSDGPDHGG